MKEIEEFKKEYKQYLEEFKHQKKLNILAPDAEPLTFEEFIPESYQK